MSISKEKQTQLQELQDSIVILSKEDLKSLMHEILLEFQESHKAEPEDEYLSSKEVCKRLHICPRTFQRYRDMRLIPFNQRGRTITVKKSDLEAFQKQFSIESRYK